MKVRITPAPLSGTVAAISSKSDAHRQLIAAALCTQQTRILQCRNSEDIEATVGCLQALGATIEREGNTLTVTPARTAEKNAEVSGFTQTALTRNCINSEAAPDKDDMDEKDDKDEKGGSIILDCRESGSTLRFLLPVAAVLKKKTRFIGCGRLPERPIDALLDTLEQNGVTASSDQVPLDLSGRLHSGIFELPGNISSQFVTGLLFALPLLEGNSTIQLTSRLESAQYVAITLSVLEQYGITIKSSDNGFMVSGNQHYQSPCSVSIEGDWSNAAFFLAAGALSAPVCVQGLSLSSPQGDRDILSFLKRFGAEIASNVQSSEIRVFPGALNGCTIDIGETPDLLPILAVVATAASGQTRFINGARLRLKESNRLHATATMIRALGGEAHELPDGLIVFGKRLSGGCVDSFHDHRIAMAAAIAALTCESPVTILDAGAVAKSYPSFYQDYQSLGGKVDVI